MGKPIGRPKLDSVIVTFRMSREGLELLKADAMKLGMGIAPYINMLAAQKRIESQAMTFVSNIPPDKLREMLAKSDE